MSSPPEPRLLLRFAFGPGIGWGHTARCLALAEAWVSAGGTVGLDGDVVLDEPWRSRFAALADERAPDHGVEYDVAVLDGYAFDADTQRRCRTDARVVAVIDDYGRIGSYASDLVIDPNLASSIDNYPLLARGTKALIGSNYALMRQPFRDAHIADASDSSREPDLVLVTLGGAPPPWADLLVTAALRDHLPGVRCERLVDATDVIAPMRRATIAISGAGTTTWELLCLGVPSVILPLADNQAPVADAVAAGQYAEVVEPSATAAQLALVVADLLDRASRRTELSDRGRSLVDGLGARRVGAHLRARLLEARLATFEDARLLWEWRNDSEVRANSFRTDPVAWDEHLTWLGARLIDDDTRLLILEYGGEPLAQVRFDRQNDHAAELSISLAATHRGRGWGSPAILAAVQDTASQWPQLTRVLARVKPSNMASVRTFELVGFVQEVPNSADDEGWLQYALPVERPSPGQVCLAGSAWTI